MVVWEGWGPRRIRQDLGGVPKSCQAPMTITLDGKK